MGKVLIDDSDPVRRPWEVSVHPREWQPDEASGVHLEAVSLPLVPT